MTLTKCFVAYPEKPLDRAESIELFISQVNSSASDILELIGWKSIAITGKVSVYEICNLIDQCQVFVCDLTSLNRSVLFQLGYAIAKNKRIWITIDSSLEMAQKNYKKLSLLSTVSYSSCENSLELTKNFFADAPYTDLDSTLLKSIYESISPQNRNPFLFYLKSEFNTDASIELSRKLKESKIRLVTDDPDEVSGQPLLWYIQNIFSSFGVVVHFISDDREENSVLLQNYKYSIVSGLAFGLSKPLLMLAHYPFCSTIDYRDLLYVHSTAQELKQKMDTWLIGVQQDYFKIKAQQQERISNEVSKLELQKIDIGEYVAENEEHQLYNYFVPTASFTQALRPSPYLLYVGRKGSGKTANLYQIAEQLETDKRNFVCIIKPIDYELEGILRLLNSSIAVVDTGYLIESLWKFLIYTELANNLYDVIKNKPVYISYTPQESEFLSYIETSNDFILHDFTWRLEYAIDKLCEINVPSNVGEQRIKLSEILHLRVLGELRELLGQLLESRNKVIILIDNLDKAWDKGGDIKLLANFLFGLLSSGQTIASEFLKRKMKFASVNLSLIIFLRSDIFNYIQSTARESDKINFTRMDWNDPILLQRVIEERFLSSMPDVESSKIWERYFIPEIKGRPTKEYLVKRIVPRPRDIIFLCKNALDNAINHQNTIIDEDDILKAEASYSEMAFNSLLAETETQFEGIEDLLYEFAGGNHIVTKAEIQEMLSRINMPESKLNAAIELLIVSTFLGLETDTNVFEFAYEESRMKVIQKLARRVADQTGLERYKINTPFHVYLEIKV